MPLYDMQHKYLILLTPYISKVVAIQLSTNLLKAKIFSAAFSVSIFDQTTLPLVRPTDFDVHLQFLWSLLSANIQFFSRYAHLPFFNRTIWPVHLHFATYIPLITSCSWSLASFFVANSISDWGSAHMWLCCSPHYCQFFLFRLCYWPRFKCIQRYR